MSSELLALTFIQPWASAMFMHKDVENRPWAPPKSLIGHRFAVHAGKKYDAADQWGLLQRLPLTRAECPQGALLGTVELLGYIDARKPDAIQYHGFIHDEQVLDTLRSSWRAPGAKFLWAVHLPRLLDRPIPCAGALSLWRVPVEHVPALRALEAP